MAFPNQETSVCCKVSSCKHHSQDDKCGLSKIEVGPREGCSTGTCEESLCSSYSK